MKSARDHNLMELIVALEGIKDGKNESLLSPELRHLLKEGLHHNHMPETLQVSAAENFQLTHQIIGGIARQALWADRNYGAFMKLYARQTAQTMEPVIPPPRESAQRDEWPEWMTQQRLAYRLPSPDSPADDEDPDDGGN